MAKFVPIVVVVFVVVLGASDCLASVTSRSTRRLLKGLDPSKSSSSLGKAILPKSIFREDSKLTAESVKAAGEEADEWPNEMGMSVVGGNRHLHLAGEVAKAVNLMARYASLSPDRFTSEAQKLYKILKPLMEKEMLFRVRKFDRRNSAIKLFIASVMKLRRAPKLSREIAQGAVDEYKWLIKALSGAGLAKSGDDYIAGLWNEINSPLYDRVEKHLVRIWEGEGEVDLEEIAEDCAESIAAAGYQVANGLLIEK